MSIQNKVLGKLGENFAVRYLRTHGFKVIDRNIRIGRGEIDIVCRKDQLIIFIEVKSRKEDTYLDLLDSISATQEEELIASSESYLTSHKLDELDYRIDLFAVRIRANGEILQYKHFEGIV